MTTDDASSGFLLSRSSLANTQITVNGKVTDNFHLPVKGHPVKVCSLIDKNGPITFVHFAVRGPNHTLRSVHTSCSLAALRPACVNQCRRSSILCFRNTLDFGFFRSWHRQSHNSNQHQPTNQPTNQPNQTNQLNQTNQPTQLNSTQLNSATTTTRTLLNHHVSTTQCRHHHHSVSIRCHYWPRRVLPHTSRKRRVELIGRLPCGRVQDCFYLQDQKVRVGLIHSLFCPRPLLASIPWPVRDHPRSVGPCQDWPYVAGCTGG